VALFRGPNCVDCCKCKLVCTGHFTPVGGDARLSGHLVHSCFFIQVLFAIWQCSSFSSCSWSYFCPFSDFHVHLSKVLKPFLTKHNLESKEGHVYQGRQYITRHFENDNEFNIILQISFQNQLNHPCFKVWIWVTLNTKNGSKNPLELRAKESVLPWFFREQGRAYWIPTSSS